MFVSDRRMSRLAISRSSHSCRPAREEGRYGNLAHRTIVIVKSTHAKFSITIHIGTYRTCQTWSSLPNPGSGNLWITRPYSGILTLRQVSEWRDFAGLTNGHTD